MTGRAARAVWVAESHLEMRTRARLPFELSIDRSRRRGISHFWKGSGYSLVHPLRKSDRIGVRCADAARIRSVSRGKRRPIDRDNDGYGCE